MERYTEWVNFMEKLCFTAINADITLRRPCVNYTKTFFWLANSEYSIRPALKSSICFVQRVVN